MTAWKKHKISSTLIKFYADYNSIKYRRTNAIHLFRIAYLSKNDEISSRGFLSDTYVINSLIFLNCHGLKKRIHRHNIYIENSFIPLARITNVTLV